MKRLMAAAALLALAGCGTAHATSSASAPQPKVSNAAACKAIRHHPQDRTDGQYATFLTSLMSTTTGRLNRDITKLIITLNSNSVSANGGTYGDLLTANGTLIGDCEK